MASTSSSGQISVVNPKFCTAYPVDMTIKQKFSVLSKTKYAVTGVNGDILFQVTGNFFGLHVRRYLLDPAGNTILTLQQSSMSMHSRWEVFRGDSTDYKNLLFSVKRSNIFQIKREYDVFMATNPEENDCCDFKFCKKEIYAGNSKNIVIAQMHNQIGFISNKYSVTVYPNVDCVFIIALVVIFQEIQSRTRRHHNNGGM
ncbi:protein LURP-one-related 15-like [Impatiens glandulifera]|uniref:protein LURP-one-related 15-like n=1 Tax=Impatiens glandulifera TaxID=253017 RepID=UPI001FB0B4E7|nr:protein LURP-one-related 15-like [Impatiens glandulifera]